MNAITLICSIFLVVLANIVKADFIYSCTEDKTIALTFDDGPHQYTKELVDYIVDKTDAKVTFFHVAQFHYPFAIDVEEYQAAMKKAHDNGLQIASHTYGHKISSDMDEFKKSLTDMDDFIEKVTGDRPHYFRAPKGECNSECQSLLDESNYRLIQWDTDTNDWDLETSGSVEQRVEDSINFLKESFAEEKSSYLILMHDSQNYTVREIAPWIIEKSGMKEKGYRFVTVAECLGDKESMYVSGKTYDSVKPIISGNVTLSNNNSTEGPITLDRSAQQNLQSSDAILTKIINNFTYLCICLLVSLYYFL